VRESANNERCQRHTCLATVGEAEGMFPFRSTEAPFGSLSSSSLRPASNIVKLTVAEVIILSMTSDIGGRPGGVRKESLVNVLDESIIMRYESNNYTPRVY
jgi:hypothetical protein